MFEVDREGQDVRAAFAVCAIETVLAADRSQMQLHGVVQPVERIIHGWQLGQQFAVVVLQRLQEGPQHGFDNVDHAQNFARGVGQRDAWRAHNGRFDVLRLARSRWKTARRHSCVHSRASGSSRPMKMIASARLKRV